MKRIIRATRAIRVIRGIRAVRAIRASTFGLIVGAALAGAALARAEGADDAAAATVQKPGDETICKRLPPPTGSRIGDRKVCKPRKDWESSERDAGQVTREVQDKSASSNLGMSSN